MNYKSIIEEMTYEGNKLNEVYDVINERKFLLLTYKLNKKLTKMGKNRKDIITIMKRIWPKARYMFEKSLHYELPRQHSDNKFFLYLIIIVDANKSFHKLYKHFPINLEKLSIIHSLDIEVVKYLKFRLSQMSMKNLKLLNGKKLTEIKEEIREIEEVIDIEKIDYNPKKLTNNIESKIYMYVIKCNGECYKIGQSNDPYRRFNALRTANPYELKLTRVYKNLGFIETKIHKNLKQFNLRGEWFSCNEEVIDKAVSELLFKQKTL